MVLTREVYFALNTSGILFTFYTLQIIKTLISNKSNSVKIENVYTS